MKVIFAYGIKCHNLENRIGGIIMFSLLIVDDHIHLVESMSTTIPFDKIGVSHIFKAYSGFEALSVMEKNDIDILISDIRMPGMSGLELIEIVRKKWPNIKCILLTGYAEFEYAKQAITYQTSDYLLKPVRDEHLIESISKVIKELEKEQKSQAKYIQIDNTLRQSLPLLKSNLLNGLLQGEYPSDHRLEELLKSYELDIKFKDDYIIMIINMEYLPNEKSIMQESLMEYALENIARETFSKDFIIWQCKDSFGYSVFLVKAVRQLNAGYNLEDREFFLRNTASQLQKNTKQYLEVGISILFSKWGNFPVGIDQLYQVCLNELWKKTTNEREYIISMSDQPLTIAVKPLNSLYELPSLYNLLESNQWDAVNKKVEKIFSELDDEHHKSIEHLYEAANGISSALSYYAHKNGRHLVDLLGEEYDKLIDMKYFRTSEVLQKWTYNAIQQLKHNWETNSDSRDSVVIAVQRYIEGNLSKDVSLQTIADIIGFHPAYLSKIYKSETSENLSEYILRLRMEKAAKLLQNNKLKIYEISEMVGYQSTQHFIRTFKKYFSKTPLDFKR